MHNALNYCEKSDSTNYPWVSLSNRKRPAKYCYRAGRARCKLPPCSAQTGGSIMAKGRRTRVLRRQLVAGFSGNDLMQARYGQRHGISVGSFHRWWAHFRQTRICVMCRPTGPGRERQHR